MGVEHASAVMKTLGDWNLLDNVVAFCFDTTDCDTDQQKGSATLIERFSKNKVPWLTCRHHMYSISVFLKTSKYALFYRTQGSYSPCPVRILMGVSRYIVAIIRVIRCLLKLYVW